MKESDVLIDSSINAISDAVEAAYDYKRNLLASFTYLTGMITLRILLCLIGSLYGFSMVSLLGLLIFNFLFDALIVFHLLFGSLKKDAIPLTFIPNLRHALKHSLNFFMPILILCACLAVAFPLLVHYVQGFDSGAMALAVLWILTLCTAWIFYPLLITHKKEVSSDPSFSITLQCIAFYINTVRCFFPLAFSPDHNTVRSTFCAASDFVYQAGK